MCRNEALVNHRLPAVGKLAEQLRVLRDDAGLTNVELAVKLAVDIVTVRRAASGNSVPKRKLVEDWAQVCSGETETGKVVGMWRQARYQDRRNRAGRPSTPLPNPDLVSSRQMLSEALAELYERAGAPSFREMEERGGQYGTLPQNTARRIVQRQTLPRDEKQFRAFLTACEVTRPNAWAAAFNRVANQQEAEQDQESDIPIDTLSGRSIRPMAMQSGPRSDNSARWSKLSESLLVGSKVTPGTLRVVVGTGRKQRGKADLARPVPGVSRRVRTRATEPADRAG
ncbi:hypothetical protein EDD99_8111 [Streptomyces sp. 846.5]|nr:helix-turn-helix domain-containing protein [Streptomyces sp. 846.5]TDT93302.1 hypothetical protein EDD99_8111 [Streptomyces sp. 846.5]